MNGMDERTNQEGKERGIERKRRNELREKFTRVKNNVTTTLRKLISYVFDKCLVLSLNPCFDSFVPLLKHFVTRMPWLSPYYATAQSRAATAAQPADVCLWPQLLAAAAVAARSICNL